MRKIVFVNRFYFPDVSATSQMLTDLAVRVARAGAQVHVICSRQLYEDPAACLPEYEITQGVHVHRVWSTQYGRSMLTGRALDYATFYATAAIRLLRLLRGRDIAVVKTDPPMLSVLAAPVVAVRGAKLVNWLQDLFPEVATRLGMKNLNPVLSTGLLALRDRSLVFAQANVVLGTRMRRYLISRDVEPERVHIIENWQDGESVAPIPAGQSVLRAQLGLGNQFVVGYSGNLGRAHEFETLLDAAIRLQAHEDIVFLMIGGGAKMQTLQHLVVERGLKNFRFLPYQPRESLADSMAAADVHLACLLPELEGLIVPSKVYGILAAGRPTVFIGDESGEVAQLLRDSRCGESVPRGNGERLANLLVELREDAARRHRQGQAARQIFESRFTLDCAVEKWLQLLDHVGMQVSTPAVRGPATLS